MHNDLACRNTVKHGWTVNERYFNATFVYNYIFLIKKKNISSNLIKR